MIATEQRFVVSTTDDVIVTPKLEKGTDYVVVSSMVYDKEEGVNKVVDIEIPHDEIVSILKESVLSEDVTEQYLSSEKELTVV